MSKRKACDDVSSSPKVATLSESPLLDLPPEIWGHINVLEWIQLDTDFPLDHGQWLYSKAIEGNQVGVFAWLVHNDIPMPEPVVYVKEAASEGRLEILKWMLDDGITIPMACYYYALKRGHRDVMLWFEKLFSPHVFGPEPADISN